MYKEIEMFYDQYIDEPKLNEQSFLGHFDIFHWGSLKNDLSACANLQRKPFYKIALLNGIATYYSNKEEFPISGYTIVFLEPMTRSRFKTDDEKISATYCVCSESFLKGATKLNLRNWPVFQGREIYVQSLSKEEYHDLSRLMLEIEEEKNSDYPFKEHLLRSRVFDIIHYIQKSVKRNDITPVHKEDTLDERFFHVLEKAFLNINPENTLAGKSPAYFADLLHTTVDYLNYSLKKATGKTTQQIIHERIIEEANVLLRHSNYSVKEIAWCLNFQETPHFLTFYKKHTNTTPLAYRAT
ncbi:AraC-type DNA-binding protein [Chitinophaga jiangningensis]|uniref:AraC-type DNA-binding protein n=1 Tax=Chitinophaga jiangningensis TaxID=1419482 RepID=A0A1M7JD13_9BACT|nr:AraC family transcriptional regulator [Chitinophaga jiangningensis]SHM50885.1 AraC-type DNA-binding protein [Chitinophaga jiangningensis]